MKSYPALKRQKSEGDVNDGVELVAKVEHRDAHERHSLHPK